MLLKTRGTTTKKGAARRSSQPNTKLLSTLHHTALLLLLIRVESDAQCDSDDVAVLGRDVYLPAICS